jgi:hypothetical protein
MDMVGAGVSVELGLGPGVSLELGLDGEFGLMDALA